MFDTIYIEEEVQDHPRTKQILQKLSNRRVISIERYGEVFNRKGQNFRTQKKNPALILAKKHGQFLHPIPSTYGIGHEKNFYFSHLYNCPFDCSYCYLQGMFRSAHFVLFVNYEEIEKAIEEKLQETKGEVCFFSGYDADSLAIEPISGFLSYFLPFFKKHPNAFLEVRTKSTAITPLIKEDPFPNAVIAYTISPDEIIKEFEPKTPSLEKRIEALRALAEKGWKIGLRFDPIIPVADAKKIYEKFFLYIFQQIPSKQIDSITLGIFRLPKSYYKNMKRIEASSTLLPLLQEEDGSMASTKEEELKEFLYQKLLEEISEKRIFVV